MCFYSKSALILLFHNFLIISLLSSTVLSGNKRYKQTVILSAKIGERIEGENQISGNRVDAIFLLDSHNYQRQFSLFYSDKKTHVISCQLLEISLTVIGLSLIHVHVLLPGANQTVPFFPLGVIFL